MAKITGTDSLQDVFVKLSEGNPGALRVCMEIHTQNHRIDPKAAMPELISLLRLDDMGIYGPEIWMLYKDVCDCNVVYLIALLRANQLGHIRESEIKLAINRQHELNLETILENVRAVLPDFAAVG